MGTKSKPSLTIKSVFGQCELTVSDGNNSISLMVSVMGIKQLIDELETVLELAEDAG